MSHARNPTDSPATASGERPTDRLARIDQRHERLLDELDSLNERIEATLAAVRPPAEV
ncbi:MAG: hypothetical protein AAFV43_09300 [Planctomycetota bacterium]